MTGVQTCALPISVLHADQILVLEDGKVVGLETHQELAKTCPLYQELMVLQLGGSENE